MKKLTKYTLSAILGIGISYNANALQFLLHNEFSGGQQPAGSLQVDITDSGADAVDLKISSLLFGTEFLDALYLNFGPNLGPGQLDPTLLSFGTPTSTGSFGTNPVVSTGANAFDADGGGSYDIKFQFDIAPPPDRFNLTDTITYHVTGITGLDANDFNFVAAPHGGHGATKPRHISKESHPDLMVQAGCCAQRHSPAKRRSQRWSDRDAPGNCSCRPWCIAAAPRLRAFPYLISSKSGVQTNGRFCTARIVKECKKPRREVFREKGGPSWFGIGRLECRWAT